jgi:tRNA-dihydrouridine synthase A
MFLKSWVEEKTIQEVPLKYLTRHMLGLFSGQPGARKFRRHLSENMTKPEATNETFNDALSFVQLL